jgi:hypothetical protein
LALVSCGRIKARPLTAITTTAYLSLSVCIQ